MTNFGDFGAPVSHGWAILSTMSRFPAGQAAASSGCYEAGRAAALSGVPTRTVYDWARKGIVVPSISPVQEKLWSYADLMALRIVAWLRRPKALTDDDRLPASPMNQVRQALMQLERMQMDIWTEKHAGGSPVVIDQRGDIFLGVPTGFVDLKGNHALPHEERFGLLGPFEYEGHRGPDLLQPRPHLRIVPERVAGEPHAEGTRLTTQTLAGLAARNFTTARIASMYEVPEYVVNEAVDLEATLNVA